MFKTFYGMEKVENFRGTQEGFQHRCGFYRRTAALMIAIRELADVVLVDMPQIADLKKGKATI